MSAVFCTSKCMTPLHVAPVRIIKQVTVTCVNEHWMRNQNLVVKTILNCFMFFQDSWLTSPDDADLSILNSLGFLVDVTTFRTVAHQPSHTRIADLCVWYKRHRKEAQRSTAEQN